MKELREHVRLNNTGTVVNHQRHRKEVECRQNRQLSIASNAPSGEASRIESEPTWRSPYEGPTPEVLVPRWPKFGLQIKDFPNALSNLLLYLPYQIALAVTCYFMRTDFEVPQQHTFAHQHLSLLQLGPAYQTLVDLLCLDLCLLDQTDVKAHDNRLDRRSAAWDLHSRSNSQPEQQIQAWN
jgi:hypothetical protein